MERISVQEAARMLGVDAQMIRIHLQREKGIFSKLGYAYKSSSGKSWRYLVFKCRVEDFIKGVSC